MSIEALLDLIRQQFSPSEGRTLVMSLQHDPLVWRFVQDEALSLPYFESASKSLESYSPGRMAAWLIQQETGVDLSNLRDLEPLPKDLKQRAAQAFETTKNTELPPTDLFNAGLLALSLREERILKGNWKGISSEIPVKYPKPNHQKYYHIWRTPFACLPQFCPDFDDLIMDFLGAKSDTVISTSIPVFIHAVLANPNNTQEQLEQLSSLIKILKIDHQLETLKWLDEFNRVRLRKSLAKHLIQTKQNLDFFSGVFSELEAVDNHVVGGDPLTKHFRYTLAEDLNRIAAFNYFSGDTKKAEELYQKSSELLDHVKNQTLFQSLVSNSDNLKPSRWLQLVNSMPESKQVRWQHIRSLIKDGKHDEAAKYLEEMPDSLEKNYLQSLINNDSDSKSLLFQDVNALITSSEYSPGPVIGYYVHTPKPEITDGIFLTLKESDVMDKYLEIADKYTERKPYNPRTINVIRDIYIKNNQYEKAICLTSYLDLLEPEDVTHKRTLAKLYTLAERWQDAYSISQTIIRSENNPRTEDLVRYAKSAMKTDRVDIAISICQNILQKAPNNTAALVLLGEGYMLKGDPVKAIQHMEQVVAMIPDEAETWLTLAHLWEKNGQTDRAFEILNKGILALPQDSQLLHALGKAYLDKKAPSDAHTCLKKAFDIEPENKHIQLDLANTNYQLGKYEQAKQLLEPFMEDYETNPSVAKLLGQVLLAMDEKQAAEPILLFAAEHYSHDMNTVLKAVHLSLERFEATCENIPEKDLDRIQSLLENARSNNQDDPQLRLHLADIMRLRGNHQNAFDAYLALSEKNESQKITSCWRFSYGLGQTAIALGDYEVGLAALQEANSKNPGNLIVLHALSEAFHAADLYEKSEQTAKTALKMAPQDIQNILWYADFKTRSNEPKKAVKALKEALQIKPGRPDLKFWLSKSLIANGDIEEAKDVLKDAVGDSQSTSGHLHQAAYLCVQINELDLAVQSLEKANKLKSDIDPTLLMDLALCYKLLGQRKNALEVLNLNKDTLEQYPKLSMLKSDLLCELGQYQLAFNKLKAVEDGINDLLNIVDEEKKSPLLYRYDFTLKGYHYRLGQLYRALGEISNAQKHLSEALEYDPEDIKIRNASAEAFVAGLDFENALAKCTGANHQESQSSQVQPYLDILCTQAEILLLQDNAEDAQALLDLLPMNETDYPRVLAIQSQLAAVQSNIDLSSSYLNNAIDNYTKEWEKDQNNSLHNSFRRLQILLSIAEAALRLQEYSKALNLYSRSEDIFDNQPIQNWRFAVALIKAAEAQQKASLLRIKTHTPGENMLSAENYDLCQTLIEKATPFLPEDLGICLKAQCVASFTGTWPSCLHIEPCLSTPEDAALVVMNCDDEEIIQTIMDTYPDNLQVCQAYGLHAMRYGKDDVSVIVNKALQNDVSNPINHVLLTFLNIENPETAVKSLETAISFWQDEPEWHALAGDLYQQIGDTTSASRHIESALDTDPENADYWRKNADIRIKTNQLQEAKEALEKSASLQSTDPIVWTKMADVNRRLGNASEAIQNIEKASELAPNDKDVAFQEINYLIEQKRFVDAEKKADEILKKDELNQEAQILLARARAEQGKFDLALESLKAYADVNPDNTRVLLETIKTKKDRDGVEVVLPELINLAHGHPEDPDILTTLTDYLIQTNRLQEAEEAAQTILRILPEQAEVHLMLGRLQRMKGQLDQAIAHLSDAIRFNPHLVEAYLELGKTYQERRDLEQAIIVFQKGSEANKSDPRPYYHAGMALKDCKDYAGAETMLKQAKKYAPDDPLIVRQLGVITALNLVNNLREMR